MAIFGIGSRVTDGTGRVGTITHVYRDHQFAPWAYVRWDGRHQAYPRPVADLRHAPRKGGRIG